MLIQYILGSAILVFAVAIIICVSVQQGNSHGLGAMAGGSEADSYYSKNKNRSRDSVLSKITVVLSVLIVICVIIMNIVSARG